MPEIDRSLIARIIIKLLGVAGLILSAQLLFSAFSLPPENSVYYAAASIAMVLLLIASILAILS